MLRWVVSGGQAVVNNNGLEAKDDDGNGLTEGSVNIKHTSSTKNKGDKREGSFPAAKVCPPALLFTKIPLARRIIQNKIPPHLLHAITFRCGLL